MEDIRQAVRKVMRKLAKLLDSASGGKISPNFITIVGLLAHVVIALLIASQELRWAALLLVIFGLFDTLDGELARLQNKESAMGMFLDSSTDRVKEVLIYVGITYAIVAVGRPYMAVWAVSALGTSMFITYINAWGEVAASRQGISSGINKKFRGGIAGFEVRMFIILLGLLSGRLILAVIVITLLGVITILQRYNSVLKVLGSHDKN